MSLLVMRLAIRSLRPQLTPLLMETLEDFNGSDTLLFGWHLGWDRGRDVQYPLVGRRKKSLGHSPYLDVTPESGPGLDHDHLSLYAVQHPLVLDGIPLHLVPLG